MPATVKRLRTGLLLAAGLLLIVLLTYFLLGRQKDKFARRDLPQRLGLNIQQDSNGFTLSKSEHGQTLFTLHASRAVQLKDGAHANLHDVKIVLYGQGEPRRRDMIQGESFGYDPKTQVVTSQGEVTIDLQAPGETTQGPVASAPIHLRTTGLTFDQKTGHASTAQQIEFRLPQLEGTAVGADYDARAGTVDLHAQVQLRMNLDDGPATMNAASAQMSRDNSEVHLARPVLHTLRRDANAAHAVLRLRSDGSADQVVAEGDVQMTSPDGMSLGAPRVVGVFDQHSRITAMSVTGGVKLHQPPSNGADGREGSAQTADVEFDALGKPRVLHLNSSVNLLENRPGAQGWQRSLRAEKVQVAFENGIASRVTASGSPVFEQAGNNSEAGDKQLKADLLEISLRNGNAIESLRGTGNTETRQSIAGKENNVGTADTLTVKFSPEGNAGNGQIQDAVQRGNVRFERSISPAKGASAANGQGDVLVGHAQQAQYLGQQQTVLLTCNPGAGNPRMTDISDDSATTEIEARQIELHRDTGVAVADGDVKASYTSQPYAEPVHIVAAHAVMVHSAGTVTFTGNPRMWQQGNSVQAPVITLDQKSQGLTAESNGSAMVRTVLVDQNASQKQPQQPMRIRSQKLVYDGTIRRARFTTGVTLVSQSGTTRADQADVYFKAAASAAPAKPTPAQGLMSGSVDRIVAEGDVFFMQPAPKRQGSGQELVYTADDGRFILTGSNGRRPRIEDEQQGTVTGDALQFSSHEDRVDVVSGTGRAVTTMRVNK